MCSTHSISNNLFSSGFMMSFLLSEALYPGTNMSIWNAGTTISGLYCFGSIIQEKAPAINVRMMMIKLNFLFDIRNQANLLNIVVLINDEELTMKKKTV